MSNGYITGYRYKFMHPDTSVKPRFAGVRIDKIEVELLSGTSMTNGAKAQTWIPMQVDQGTILVNMLSGLVMTVSGYQWTYGSQIAATRTYVEGNPITEALWMRGDDYRLLRMDGTEILRWATRNEDIQILDGWHP